VALDGAGERGHLGLRIGVGLRLRSRLRRGLLLHGRELPSRRSLLFRAESLLLCDDDHEVGRHATAAAAAAFARVSGDLDRVLQLGLGLVVLDTHSV
jgi:hypothetical protein